MHTVTILSLFSGYGASFLEHPARMAPIATRAAMLKYIVFLILLFVLMGLLFFNVVVPVEVLEAISRALGNHSLQMELMQFAQGSCIHFFLLVVLDHKCIGFELIMVGCVTPRRSPAKARVLCGNRCKLLL